jgi:hypothetical protein
MEALGVVFMIGGRACCCLVASLEELTLLGSITNFLKNPLTFFHLILTLKLSNNKIFKNKQIQGKK